VRLAQILCERIPSVERVRFTNSGSEGVMTAIKAARAFTGRQKIAKCEGSYHGSYDFAEVSLEPTPENWGDEDAPASVPYVRGTPEGVLSGVVVLPYNNATAAERLITRHKDELACVVVDLMPGRLGFVQIAPEFLATVRRLTKAYGIVLIFDEVITLRLGYGGNQKEVGVMPDLTAMGKIIGGGFPVGAVGGRAEIMSVFDPSRGKPLLTHAGTFNANPITMAAGRRMLELLTPEEFDRINRLGATARSELVRMFKEEDVPAQITGKGSLFNIAFYHQPVTSYRSVHRESARSAVFTPLFLYLLNHGVLIGTRGMGAISTPMTQREVESFVNTVRAGVRELKRELVPA
jgi:glutamate-1-semialdehyde 2,1-aminomutase